MALTDGIVGCWSPSIRGSGYLLPDLVRGNHGTLTNMDAGTDWVGASVRGVSSRVLDYDGTNDRVSIGAAAVKAAPLTISAWINVANYTANRTAVVIHSAGVSRFLLYITSLGAPAFFVTDGTFSQALVSIAVPTNTWVHVLGVESGGSRKVVYNATSEASASGTITPAAINGVQIGADSASGTAQFFMAGQIGEVSIYNRALTQPEVLEIVRRGNGAIGRELTGQTRRRVYGFVPAGFKAYWARRQSQIIGGGVR